MDLSGRVEAGGHHVVLGHRAAAQKLLAPLVVDADNAARGVVLREQARLRFEVRLERMVVVQVVLRQVGKRRDGEGRAPRALQIERVRADLHGHRVATLVAHAREQLLQIRRFGRGMRGFLVHAAHANAHGSDDARALAGHLRDMLHQVGGGGLAVRAGDAHQRQVLGRMVVEVRRRNGHGLARVLHHDLRDVSRVGQVHFPLDDQHLRTAIDGVLRKGMAVRREADDAEERVARLNPVAAIGDALRHVVSVADNGAVYAREQFGTGLAHSFLTPDIC